MQSLIRRKKRLPLDSKGSYMSRLKKDLVKNRSAYVLFLPVLAFYLIFCYKPMYGLIIAFKDFTPYKGILDSPWAADFGFKHFISFFSSVYFGRLIKNTLVISITNLLVTFPAPIILALLLNEVRCRKYKSMLQTLTYLPHFISMVVICSMVRLFVDHNGFITQMLSSLGLVDGNLSMLSNKNYFVPIYVLSGLWQTIGWSAIIYISALAGVDQELYEAARIDGANRWKQTIHVTLPAIMMTIIMMFIMRIGTVMSVGYEKIILLYNPGIYETADVISSYVYRKGLQEADWSYAAAVGFFNSVINLFLVVTANKITKKVTDMGLW
ncbi:ABC transporter permease subunit [Clostridium sp. HBUAS56010]|uniref:ABC transporter permease n=1 Tax=Clostridium sp. HBUAS56010 TaxID=2571127 RepID=UPI001177AC6D|nr:ABC transporter permease subunit [Clostridium sp. HBUAS56010]